MFINKKLKILLTSLSIALLLVACSDSSDDNLMTSNQEVSGSKSIAPSLTNNESNSTNTYLINKINTIKKNILNTKSNENFYMNVVKKLVWGFIIILSIAFIYFILVNLNIKRIKNSSNN